MHRNAVDSVADAGTVVSGGIHAVAGEEEEDDGVLVVVLDCRQARSQHPG
jgi:hypothetical protein